MKAGAFFQSWVNPLCLAGLGCGLVGPAAPALAAEDKEEVFTLREVSAFERPDQNFIRGQSAACQDQPFSQVKAYPKFSSKKPVYGMLSLGGRATGPKSSRTYYFAVDESQGKGYDRLYFDLNQDLDLRNDPVVQPMRERPQNAALPYSNIKEQVLFEPVAIDFDCGPAGTRAVPLLPRLTRSAYDTEEYKQMSFVRTRIYQGDIKLGSQEFRARLGNDYVIAGRLDAPETVLLLSPKDKPDDNVYWWWGGDRLSAVHKVDGKFYTFTASPTGEKLTVRPYQGELGAFEIGPGKRALDKLAVSGSLRATNMAVPIGGQVVDGSAEMARSCQVPVGDFLPSYLTLEFGRLRISLSDNYHADGQPRGRGARPPVYGIQVRKDRPFVLDFSNPPEVLFASPAKAQRIKVGESLEVKAVLVDPKLDIMIRGVDDTTRKQTKTADGRPLNYQRNLSLDPSVIITRTNGEKVAEGVMPFG